MTPEQIALVKHSWQQSNPTELAITFYKKLFEINPDIEDLFLNSLALQREKFTVTLSLLISQLDNPTELLPRVQLLGIQHAGYGVTDEHYDQVLVALLFALEQQLGAELDGCTRKAWEEAYQALARTMKMAETDTMSRPH